MTSEAVTLFLTIFVSLFSVVDPPGAMPMFLALTSDTTRRDRRQIAFDTSLYFAIILILFYFVGSIILTFLGISIDAMRVAGGFVIFASGQGLMKSDNQPGSPHRLDEDVKQESMRRNYISLTPLAMPMLSGPGSISLLIGMNAKHTRPLEYGATVAAVLATALVTYGILLVSPLLLRIMGKAGLVAFSRILGFFVMAIGVQFVINGSIGVYNEFIK